MLTPKSSNNFLTFKTKWLKPNHDRINSTSSINMIIFHVMAFVLWSLLQLTLPRYHTLWCEWDTSWVRILSSPKSPFNTFWHLKQYYFPLKIATENQTYYFKAKLNINNLNIISYSTYQLYYLQEYQPLKVFTFQQFQHHI